MATGLSNKLTGQIGEYLACAQLGKRGFIATSFTGNVPEFDLIITNEELKTIPIQVKTTRGTKWPTRADNWIEIEIDHKEKKQIDKGNKIIKNPGLIYICISLAESDKENDRYFILTKQELQEICARNYREWMRKHDWKRPVNYESLDNRYSIDDLLPFENNWDKCKL
jgi:hypothetical protein